MLSPLSGAGGPPLIQQNASEAEIFYNATGFLRCWERPGRWPWGQRVPGRSDDKAEPARRLGEVDRPSKAQGLMWEWDRPPGVATQFEVSRLWGLQVQVSLTQEV